MWNWYMLSGWNKDYNNDDNSDDDDDDQSDSVYDENLVKSDDQPSPSHSARTSPRDISQLTKHTALLDKYTNTITQIQIHTITPSW